MTRDEKRFLRRENISRLLQAGFTSVRFIAYLTRNRERENYGQYLNIYSMEG